MTTNSFSLQTLERLDNNEDVIRLKQAINEAITESKEIDSVLTSLDVEKASHYTKGFSKVIKQAESLRKLEKEPYSQAAKDVDNFFKSLTTEAQAEMERLDKHILNWTREQQRIAREKAEAERKEAEERAIAEAIEKENKMKEEAKANGQDETQVKVEVAIVPETVTEAPKLSQKNTSGVSTMKVAKWRIIDEDLIPREYLIVNESKITAVRKAAGAENCNSTIPGIEFYFDETLAKR